MTHDYTENCCFTLLRLGLLMMCLSRSVCYGADSEPQWESVLNCTNISLTHVKLTNLVLGISASICLLISILILILLLCFKEYKTPLQRMVMFLTLLTIVQEAGLAASLEHQIYYSGQEQFCEILGFFNQCTGTMIYMFSAQLSIYLFYMVYKRLFIKADSLARNSQSRLLSRLFEGIYLFVPAALIAIKTGYPYLVGSKYGFSGSYCWIQAFDDDCNKSGLGSQVFSYAVNGGLGIISVTVVLAMVMVYIRIAYVKNTNQIMLLLRKTLLLMVFLIIPPMILAIGIVGRYSLHSFPLSIADSVSIPLSSLVISTGYLMYKGKKKSYGKKKLNRQRAHNLVSLHTAYLASLHAGPLVSTRVSPPSFTEAYSPVPTGIASGMSSQSEPDLVIEENFTNQTKKLQTEEEYTADTEQEDEGQSPSSDKVQKHKTQGRLDKDIEDETEAQDKFQKLMKNGYVLCHIHTLMLIGVAGAGKTSFLHLALKLPPPSVRESTTLARNSIRAVSVSRVTASKDEYIWHSIPLEKLTNWIADRSKCSDTFKPPLSSFRPDPSTVQASVQHTVDTSDAESDDLCEELEVAQSPSSDLIIDETNLANQTETNGKTLLEKLRKKKCVQDILKRIKDSTDPIDLIMFDDHWVYLVDTGGQPQFQDLLPTFIHNISGAAIFVKLNESLDHKPEIAYYSEGGHLSGTPYSSSLTHMETMQSFLQMLQSRRNLAGEIECPQLFCVGTHRDLLCKEDLMTKNRRLLEMFRIHEKIKQNLAYYRVAQPEELLYPVNAKDPQDEDHKVAEKFRKAVMSQCRATKKKIPLRWFILERLLQQISIDKQSFVLSLEECRREAGDLEIDDTELKAALNYLVRLNIFQYFPNDLPDLVFTTSQVFLDKISELVEYSHYLRGERTDTHVTESDDSDDSKSALQFRDYGILTTKFLQKKFPKHYINGVFTSKDLLKILTNKLVLAYKSGHNQYFMPCVLSELKSEDLEKYRTNEEHSAVSPLLIYCPNGLVPSGNFTGLVAYLQNTSSWKIAERNNLPKCLFKNCVRFKHQKGPEIMTLIYSYDYIEVYVKVPEKLCLTSCPKIAKTLLVGLTEAAKALKCTHLQHQLAFLCSCKEHHLPHLATICESEQGSYSICSKNDEHCKELSRKQLLWLEGPGFSKMRSNTPTLLAVLKVLLPMASKWQTIATLLGVPQPQVEMIQKDHGNSCQECLRVMISKWLEQIDPKPSWVQLAEVAESLGNPALASEIRDKMNIIVCETILKNNWHNALFRN